MSTRRLLRLIATSGRFTEPLDAVPHEVGVREGFEPARSLRGSAQCRHVDVGSCNGCEIEIGQAFGPVYDADQYGARLVASPRHADVLLCTGVVTHNMREALDRTVEATPEPRVVIAIGDCAIDGGLLAGGFGVHSSVCDATQVDLTVPGCPPPPEAIIAALRKVTRR